MGDFNGKNYDDQFVGSLVTFVANDKFQSMFESFFLTHAIEFTNDEEHKLRYYELYQEFHTMFEVQLEEFCVAKGVSQAAFMARCKEASTEDPKAKHYIDILLSSVEYDTFVKLMKIMRPVAAARMALAANKKADAKLSLDDVEDIDFKGLDVKSSPSKEVAENKEDDTVTKTAAIDNDADAKISAARSDVKESSYK